MLIRQCSDFRDGGFHWFDWRFRRSLGERPNASVSHLRSTDVLHRRPLARRTLSGSDCASWTMGESCAVTCAVTCAEGYQAANDIGGTLTCAYDEVAGDVVLEVAVSKRWSVVCSLDDPSTGVRHECRVISYQGSCVVTCTKVMQLMGVFPQLSCFVFRRMNVSAMHKLSTRRVRRCSALTF